MKRITRILKTPEEILYSVTRHWILIIIFISAGTLIMWRKVSMSPLIYEGQAQLLVNPIDTLVISERGRPQGRSADEIQRFLISQSNILSSQSVLLKLMKMIGVEGGNFGEKPLDLIQSVKEKIGIFFYGEDKYILEPDQDNEIQSAITRFRLRSQVKPDLSGNTIKLLVYGTNKEIIQKELSGWINAYSKHVEEMARDRLEDFLKERVQYYQQIEASSLKELEAFNKANPEVSVLNQEFLSQEIARLQVLRDDFRREMDFGIAPLSAPNKSPSDADMILLQKYENELIDLLSRGFNDNSEQVQQVRKKIILLKSRMADGESKIAAPDEEQKFQQKFEKITKSLEDLLSKNAIMKEKLKILEGLEESYKQARDKRMKYALITQESLDTIESMKTVQIQVTDKPMVSAEPIEYHPLRKLLHGFLGGAGLGLVVSLMIEIFRSRIRFTNDIVHDVGLPVISVIPKR